VIAYFGQLFLSKSDADESVWQAFENHITL